MWERDGSAIIYHGEYAKGAPYLGRVKADGGDIQEITIQTGCNHYGHFTVGAPNTLVSDGYYKTTDDKDQWGGQWICRLDANWDKSDITWTPLCRNGSGWKSQDAHPHPIIDHANRHVYFTSDMDGKRAVYRVPLTT
jgi:oligogalacturonide lyase